MRFLLWSRTVLISTLFCAVAANMPSTHAGVYGSRYTGAPCVIDSQ
jgi:hypothetical protein